MHKHILWIDTLVYYHLNLYIRLKMPFIDSMHCANISKVNKGPDFTQEIFSFSTFKVCALCTGKPKCHLYTIAKVGVNIPLLSHITRDERAIFGGT